MPNGHGEFGDSRNPWAKAFSPSAGDLAALDAFAAANGTRVMSWSWWNIWRYCQSRVGRPVIRRGGLTNSVGKVGRRP